MGDLHVEKKIIRNRTHRIPFPIIFLSTFFISVAFPLNISWAAAPSTPSNLTATATSSSQINLSWKDNSTNEIGFSLERATASGGPYTVIKTLGANVTSYSDTGRTQITTYYYRIRAYNTSGTKTLYSKYSNTASATTLTLAAPSNLTAAVASLTQINLSWTDNTNYETRYDIERGTSSGGPFSALNSVGANVTTYSDTSAAKDTTYYYRVRAYDGTNYSAYSNVANATIITITASAGPGGTISPSGTILVNYGASQTFTISPNTGYSVTDVVVDTTQHLGAVPAYTFTNITISHTIAANFADVTAPTGAVVINSGAILTNNPSVTLTLSASDSGSGVAEMQLSNDGNTWSAPEPFAATKAWTLASGDGAKTVYAKFKDNTGNWSNAVPGTNTITLDTTRPVVTIASPAAGLTNNKMPLLTYTVSDGTVIVKVDGVVVPKVSGDNLDVLADGPHTVRVEATDAATNEGFAEVNITVDATPPTVSINPVTTPTTVNSQTITGSMETSATVTVSVNTTATVGPVSHPTAITWSCTLTNLAAGANDITVTAADSAGNSATATASITLSASLLISNVTSGRNTIDTSTSETTSIFFTLNAGPATATLKIYPEKQGPTGTPVFQASQTCSSSGAYSFTWDGRNSAGQVVPDEAYLYVLEATDGSNVATYSPAQPTGTGTVNCTPAASYNPYNNTPLTISYTLPQLARVDVSVLLGADTFKILNAVPKAAGTYTVDWDGRNTSGTIIPLIINIGCAVSSLIRENYIITTGDTPKITQLKTDPYEIHLSYGQTTKIKYVLSIDANVTVQLISPTGAAFTLISNQPQAAGVHTLLDDNTPVNLFDMTDTTGKKFLVSEEGNYTVLIQAVNSSSGSSSIAKGILRIGY